MKEHLENVHQLARKKMLKASDRQKRTYDHRAKQYSYSDGDLVWLQTKRKRSLAPKLQYSWEGPYCVLQQLTDLVYRIQRSPQSVTKIVNHNHLKPYVAHDQNINRTCLSLSTLEVQPLMNSWTSINRKLKILYLSVLSDVGRSEDTHLYRVHKTHWVYYRERLNKTLQGLSQPSSEVSLL